MNNDFKEFLNEEDKLINNTFFDLENNIINPTEPFQNIFNQTLNLKDYDASNFLMNENINSIINELNIEIKSHYDAYSYDEIISLLENHFGNNFFQLNSSLLYLIFKLKFFYLLKSDKTEEVIKFYDEKFLPIIKLVKMNNWVIKNKVFEKLIRKPEKLKNKNILEKYYKHFQFELNKAINKFLYNEDKEGDFIFDKPTKPNKNLKKKNKKEEPLINLLNFSNNQNNNFQNTIPLDNPSINIEYFKTKNQKRTFNHFIITNSKNNNKKNNNEEIDDNSELTLYKQLPFLSSFKPHYAKRETLDKKIIRTFRQYLIEENKKNLLILNSNSKDYLFYISLIKGTILPPSNFYDNNTNENITFKSFNCRFLLFFFSREGIKDLYIKFINVKGNNFINQVSIYYKLNQKESEQLSSYVNNFPFIFDLTLVNNLTKGNNFFHIYRKQKNNKGNNKKLLFKTTKYKKKKKERSRSKTNNNDEKLNKSSSSIED